MLKDLARRALQRMDIEMFREGWWMMLAIMGTIAILFAVCTVLVARHGG